MGTQLFYLDRISAKSPRKTQAKMNGSVMLPTWIANGQSASDDAADGLLFGFDLHPIKFGRHSAAAATC
jgi:hypothetical protein